MWFFTEIGATFSCNLLYTDVFPSYLSSSVSWFNALSNRRMVVLWGYLHEGDCRSYFGNVCFDVNEEVFALGVEVIEKVELIRK